MDEPWLVKTVFRGRDSISFFGLLCRHFILDVDGELRFAPVPVPVIFFTDKAGQGILQVLFSANIGERYEVLHVINTFAVDINTGDEGFRHILLCLLCQGSPFRGRSPQIRLSRVPGSYVYHTRISSLCAKIMATYIPA